ncbi:MAG: transcriptional repressor LexA [Clostridia bacterium]|nr:transcriptional repressor LexA [Clostridia bacterium]
MAANIDKQQQILNFIKKQVSEKGYPPTVREICEAVGLNSPSTVHGYLKRLERDGHIIKESGSSRGLRLSNVPTNISSMEKEYLEVPVIGRVSAGLPILAEENLERTFPLPMDFAKKNDVYMLRVRGESMINAGIFDGDYVIVEKCETARNGEMVVALVEDSATVKTFYKENNHFRLQPENDYMEPIIVDSVSILGKVVGVYRLL